MGITKHFYRFEEVRAAFLYSIRTRRTVEALFWLEEFEVSCYTGEARRLLFVAWFLFVGLSRMSWLLNWSELGSTREGRQHLCAQLSSCSERDSSLWVLITSIALGEPTAPICKEWQLAQTNSSCFATKHNDERILIIRTALQTNLKGYSLFANATAFAIGACWKTIPQSSWAPLSRTNLPINELSSWETLSMRKRRVFAIPYDCLFGMCWRGIGGDTTNELFNLSKELFQRSPYWKSIATWETDDEQEEFYDVYFPDDIPDEWSREDQNQSHGAGITGSIESPLGRWWRNWIPEEAQFIPSSVHSNCRTWVSNQTIGNYGSVLDRFRTLYTHP